MIFAVLGWVIPAGAQSFISGPETNAAGRMVVVQGAHLLAAFRPDEARVEAALGRGLMAYTGQPTVSGAWLSLVSTNDVVGIKVFSAPGGVSGTRVAVVSAMARGLLAAGLPRERIVVWDRHLGDLRNAGFDRLTQTLGVRVAGAAEAGYDSNAFYLPDSPVVGQLVWGDLEFGRTNQGVIIGKKSFVSNLVSRQLTKIISVAPLMNETDAGLCGHFFSLALGSVDNTRRFEGNAGRLAVALPEIVALPQISDRVVLYVTDALLAQYEGGPAGYLQFTTVQDELWLGRDPVALDVLGLKELTRQRRLQNAPLMFSNFAIYTNAVLLQLGVDDPARMRVEKVR